MRRILIPLLLLFITVLANARSSQVYAVSNQSVHHIQNCGPVTRMNDVPMHGMRGQCIMTTGVAYTSNVYEPFGTSTPAEYTEEQVRGTSSGGHSGPRKGKILGPDTDPGQQFPIGEPWIMAIFALLFGGIIALRRGKKYIS